MDMQTAYSTSIIIAALTGAFLIARVFVVENVQVMGFFKEDNGNLSNTRLNTTMMCCAGCFIAIYAVIAVKVDGLTIWLVCSLCGIGIAAKVAQKGAEESSPGVAQQEAAK